jgi:hypothetical protein
MDAQHEHNAVQLPRDHVTAEHARARAGWCRRALLVGGGFQAVFGALWMARGLAPLVPVAIALALGAAALAAGLTAALLLRRGAPRPRGSVAKAIERRLTGATIAQLIASFALPVVIGAALGPRLVVPSIVLTIGVLLVWLHYEIGTPYQGAAGWALIGLAVVCTPFAGSTQTVIAGLCSAAVLLGCAGVSFVWLRQHAALARG